MVPARPLSHHVILLSVVLFCVIILLAVHRKPNSLQFLENQTTTLQRRVDQGPASCGQICSYDETVLEDQVALPKGQMYPQLQKEMNCDNIMARMAYRNHTIVKPPPEYPPENLLQEFTMNGKMPIRYIQYFKNEWSDDKPRHIDVDVINNYITRVKEGQEVNIYGNTSLCVEKAISRQITKIRGGHGVVIGTMRPWLEAIFLANGAERVTTLEYGSLILDHPQLESYTPYTYAEKYNGGEAEMFDFGATFSSLEHAGLGRYGDPLNPYGDLEAMAQVWCMIKPGGFFAVGVPYSEFSSYMLWNSARFYSVERLQHLTANWAVTELVQCTDRFHHAFVLLTKPE